MKNNLGSLNNLKNGAHIHMMGICGTAMSSLAGLLVDCGFKVTGSDSNPYPPMSTQIEKLGIKIQKPYSVKNLSPKPDFIIVGNVISAKNEEAMGMMESQIPHCSLPQAMGEFIIGDRNSYVISGTHGKTTTTSMVSWILDHAGFNPGFLIGGIPKNFDQSFRSPLENINTNSFVIEGDEYDTAYFDKVPKFIHYRPQQVILTSVEFDHADIYKDLDDVKSSFVKLMKLIPESGHFLFWGDHENVQDVAQSCLIKNKYSFGFNQTNNFVVKIIHETESTTSFVILKSEQELFNINISQIGKYNVLNAAAAACMTYLNNVPKKLITSALESFLGVRRRQEILGVFGGVTVIEDFAHHPTAVHQTIEAVQAKYKNQKVFSVFEPRSATSRRKIFQKEYLNAFLKAQEALIAKAFDQSSLKDDDKFSTADLVEELKQKACVANEFSTVDDIVTYLVKNSNKNDVILIMSNGGFDGIYDKLKAGLSNK